MLDLVANTHTHLKFAYHDASVFPLGKCVIVWVIFHREIGNQEVSRHLKILMQISIRLRSLIQFQRANAKFPNHAIILLL